MSTTNSHKKNHALVWYIQPGGISDPEVFRAILRDMQPHLPLILALTEFQIQPGTVLGLYEHIVAQELRGSHWLVGSPGVHKGGVALLLSSSVAPGLAPPPVTILVPGRLIEVSLRLSLAMPGPTSVVCFYGSNLRSERLAFSSSLAPLLSKPCMLLGDFNAITHDSDTTISQVSSLKWPWLQEKESTQQLIDVVRIAHKGSPPHTRVRGYGVSTSYLDRIYATKSLIPFLEVHHGSTLPIPRSPPSETNLGYWSDHDMVRVDLQPWAVLTDPTPSCIGWTKKHIQKFQGLMKSWVPPTCDDPVGQYESLRDHMREAYKMTCQTPIRRNRPQGQSWAEYVRSLLRLARRNPKLFFRRVKSYNLFTPHRPWLPVTAASVMRLMQTNNAWDPTVTSALPLLDSDEDPPLPTDEELRAYARVPRFKSPGPDGIPPYLFYILPDSVFSVVGNVVRELLCRPCARAGIFESTLVSLFKGKGDWGVVSNWRPISMANGIYRILMRSVQSYVTSKVLSLVSTEQ